ncbi:MAG: hypothetical protein HY040_03590 [Planctomycetes bacterium]|nr:hypothetical protein [Planctomycetota bacterium]
MGRVLLYLVFGGVWLVVGGVMLVLPLFDARFQRFTILGTDIALGWFVLLLAAYNFLKAWLWSRRSREATMQDERRQCRLPPGEDEYDPTFDFDKGS